MQKQMLEMYLKLLSKISKKQLPKKINRTEAQIAELSTKIATVGKELGAIYEDHIYELEHTRKTLICKLQEYKELGADEWEFFKHQFDADLEGFEKALSIFVENLKKK